MMSFCMYLNRVYISFPKTWSPPIYIGVVRLPGELLNQAHTPHSQAPLTAAIPIGQPGVVEIPAFYSHRSLTWAIDVRRLAILIREFQWKHQGLQVRVSSQPGKWKGSCCHPDSSMNRQLGPWQVRAKRRGTPGEAFRGRH